MRCHLTMVRMAIIKWHIINASVGVEKWIPLYTADRYEDWCSYYGTQYRRSLKN